MSSPPPLLLLCSGLLPDGVGEYRKSMKSKSILYKSILKWQKTTTARLNRFATPLLKINIRLNLAVKIDILWWWGSPRVFDKAPTRCRYSRTSMNMFLNQVQITKWTFHLIQIKLVSIINHSHLNHCDAKYSFKALSNQFFLWSNKHPSHSDSSVSATFLPTSVTTLVFLLCLYWIIAAKL